MVQAIMQRAILAFRDSAGRFCADTYDPTHTSVPREFVTKVAHARQVRR
jgi:hypothetical protein